MTLKYNELMDEVKVTDEMRERILNNLSNHEEKKKKVVRFPVLKILVPLVACVAAVIVCVNVLPGKKSKTPDKEIDLATVYEVIECKDLSELSNNAGFKVTELQNIPFEITAVDYTWDNSGYAGIRYTGTENIIFYRMTKGIQDISGDYEEYENITEENIGNITVTFKENDGLVYLAIWNDGTYSYSIGVSSGVSKEDMFDMAKSIITNC